MPRPLSFVASLTPLLTTLVGSPALAQFDAVAATRAAIYVQTAPNSAGAPVEYRWSVFATTPLSGQVLNVTVTPPVPTPPVSLPGVMVIGDLFSTSVTRPTRPQLDTDFPSGPYAFAFAGGAAGSGGFISTFTYPDYPAAAPALTSAAIANLGAVIPGQPIPITLANSVGVTSAVIIDPATNYLGAAATNLGGATSFNMPTSLPSLPLLPFHTYQLRLILNLNSPSVSVPVPGFPNRTELAAAQAETRFTFTTIPVPGAAALIGLYPFLAFRRAR